MHNIPLTLSILTIFLILFAAIQLRHLLRAHIFRRRTPHV